MHDYPASMTATKGASYGCGGCNRQAKGLFQCKKCRAWRCKGCTSRPVPPIGNQICKNCDSK